MYCAQISHPWLQVFLAWLLVKEGFNRTVDTPGEFTAERATLLVPFTVVWAVLLVRPPRSPDRLVGDVYACAWGAWFVVCGLIP